MPADRDRRLAEAVALRADGRAADARPLLIALAVEFPNDAEVQYQAAWVHDYLGLEAEAVPHYERALALDPDFADAHYNLAGLCEQLGRGADALRHYRAYKRLAEST